MPDVPATLRRRRFIAVCSVAAATALLIGGLMGCDPDQPTPPPTSPPASSGTPTVSTPSPTPTPTPTPSPTSQREKDEAAIKQAILAYYEVANIISMDPDTDFAELKAVASGQLLESQIGSMKEWRAKGYRATKAIEVERVTVQKIEKEKGERTAVATYCIDLTGVDVVDRDGNSQVVDGRPDKYPAVTKLSQRKDGRWIPFQEHTVGDACDNV